MIPFAAAIPVLIAIAVIPPVLAPDSDPIQFLQGIIPSIQVACAQPGPLCFLVEPTPDIKRVQPAYQKHLA